MIDVSKLTADEILAIPIESPEILFSADPAELKKQYRVLAKIWHPDGNPAGEDIFQHINVLKDKAEVKMTLGLWDLPGKVRITSKVGTNYEISYRAHHQFEMGDLYAGDVSVIYLINDVDVDLVNNARSQIKGITYQSDRFRKEFERQIPKLAKEVEMVDRRAIIFQKKRGQILLRDVLNHFRGKMDPKHVAWIVSRMYNLACFLRSVGLTHNDISPDTIYIDPENHYISLVGGWWYVTPIGSRLTAIPSRTMLYAPADVVKAKTADPIIDNELIKATARELLGDVSGSKLLYDPLLPKPMVSWATDPSTDRTPKEYLNWQDKVLPAAFGPRTFVELDLTPDDVYPHSGRK